MAKLKGTTVILWTKRETGRDEFNAPLFEDVKTEVENVLISPSRAEDVTFALDLYGKKAVYTLAIPKGDTHGWEDSEVEFFGKRFRVFGPVLEGIESLIPLDWNKKVTVERVEQAEVEG